MLRRYLPILDWLPRYRGAEFRGDLVAGVIITLMLIPQSMAYALLADLPPQTGLYASLMPLVVYAIFGSSRTLAVGPVALLSLMTATAIAGLGITDPASKLSAALVLAAMVGLMSVGAGLLRLGFLSNVLSHPVISGFVSASAILIAVSQLGPILGIRSGGQNIVERLQALWAGIGGFNPTSLIMGGAAVAMLIGARRSLRPLLTRIGIRASIADVVARSAPAIVVVACTVITASFRLDLSGMAVVGDIPAELPPLTLPPLDPHLWSSLFTSAVLIALVSFVESISVAQSFAAKSREKLDANQELVGLGAANLSAALTGGYPVTGGFARTAVNFTAGARTPLAGVFTAILVATVGLSLTPWFYYLPKTVLAATIVAAVISLVDIKSVTRAWRFSRPDAIAELVTILVVLFVGIEIGVAVGVVASFLLYITQTSRPHIAVVGRVPGTEHYRNVLRHRVETQPNIVALRPDENLYFINARHLEDSILGLIAGNKEVTDVIMIMSAVSFIDGSALEMLRALNDQLKGAGIRLNLAEVKGPVMDRLKRTEFLNDLSGKVYLSTHAAFEALTRSEPASEDYVI